MVLLTDSLPMIFPLKGGHLQGLRCRSGHLETKEGYRRSSGAAAEGKGQATDPCDFGRQGFQHSQNTSLAEKVVS